MAEKNSISCKPVMAASPLWTRAPARDESGQPYNDFMMLIPGLKKETDAVIEVYLIKIRQSLGAFENVVVYVDLNIKLGLLWITTKPVPGITKHIMLAIQREIPHAKVVASDFNPEPKPDSGNWLVSIGRRVKRHLSLTQHGSGD